MWCIKALKIQSESADWIQIAKTMLIDMNFSTAFPYFNLSLTNAEPRDRYTGRHVHN